MPIAKRTKTEEVNVQEHVFQEFVSLKQNNRELAKSLAEKRKENIELKQIEYKYHILENKFSMNQEVHLSLISNLEQHLTKTCLNLLNVVESLTLIQKTLHKERRRFRLSKELLKDDHLEKLEDDQPLLCQGSHPLQNICNDLKVLTSTVLANSIDSRNLTNIDKEVLDHRNVDFTEKLNMVIEIYPLPEGETQCVSQENGSCSTEFQSPTDAENAYHIEEENLQNVCINGKITDGPEVGSWAKNINLLEDSVQNETSDLERTEDTIVYVNEGHNTLESSTVLNPVCVDSYNFSQDEDFQNFLADEETIIRRGADQENVATPPWVDTSEESSAARAVGNAFGGRSSYVEHDLRSDDSDAIQFNSSQHSTRTRLVASSCENELFVSTTKVGDRNREDETLTRSTEDVVRSQILDSSIEDDVKSVASSKARLSVNKLHSPPGSPVSDICCSGRKTIWYQSPEEQNPCCGKARRKSNVVNNTFYCEPESPISNIKKYLRRYKYLLSQSDKNINNDARSEKYSGKENVYHKTHSTENKECLLPKDRKPLQDRQIDYRDEQTPSVSENTNIGCPVTNENEAIQKNYNSPNNLASHTAEGDSIQAPEPQKKSQKLRRNKKKSRVKNFRV